MAMPTRLYVPRSSRMAGAPPLSAPPPAPSSTGRFGGDWLQELRDGASGLASTIGRRRMIAGGVGLGALLAAANEMGDKNENARQNLVDATGAGAGAMAGVIPLALGVTGPLGWLAGAGLALAGSQIGKAGLRGATDLIGLTTTESPEGRAIRMGLNASNAQIRMDANRRLANLPIARQEMALQRENDMLRMKQDLEARQQAAYAQAVLAMAQGGTTAALNTIPRMAQQVLAMPTPY